MVRAITAEQLRVTKYFPPGTWLHGSRSFSAVKPLSRREAQIASAAWKAVGERRAKSMKFRASCVMGIPS